MIVDLADAAPDVWSWSWWTQLVIPLLGVAASTFVGVVAIVIAVRIARRDREERDWAARRRVVAAVRPHLVTMIEGPPRTRHDAHDLRRGLWSVVSRSAVEQGVDSASLTRWLSAEGDYAANRFFDDPADASPEDAMKANAAWIRYWWRASAALDEWLHDGKFHEPGEPPTAEETLARFGA